MSVIKANAYGHGLVPVANSLSGVDAFAVARLSEAIELREHGIQSEIVLLAGVYNDEELQSAMDLGLQLVVHCNEQLALLDTAEDGALTVWLKIDTGMNRLGFQVAETAGLLAHLRRMRAVSEVRLMSHFSCADELDNNETVLQLERFVALFDDQLEHVSLCNSAAVLGWPAVCKQLSTASHSQWIRPGIALFGISPFADKSGIDLGLKPVMQFEARLIATKNIAAGERVGYKQTYQSDVNTVLGLISAGYGDGYSRHFKSGTPVLLNGRKVPLAGNVSMDVIAVDLGAGASDQVGDIATLWGDGLSVEEVAPWADAIAYELVCGVMNRETSQLVE